MNQQEIVETQKNNILLFGKRAKKFATVSARPAIVGESIVTTLKDGHEETKNFAKEGQYVVKNPGGECYLVDGETFKKRYEFLEGADREFQTYSAKGEGIFLQIEEDLTFIAPWGAEMNMRSGDYLCLALPDQNEIYGIGQKEFHETYRFVN